MAALPSPRQSSISRSPPPTPPAAERALPPLHSMSSGLAADLARLLDTGLLDTTDGVDVEFEVGGKVFAAHKLVLAARSPVFRADFFGDANEEATAYVRICDMHPDTFEALLHYVYTDSLPQVAVIAGGGGARPEEAAAAAVLVQDLLRAADRYGLRDLKSLAETELCRRRDVVGVDTVLPMLALAEHHQCWKLKSKCLEFIASSGEKTRAVMATDDVEHLARSCPSVVKELIAKILEAKEASSRLNDRPETFFSFYLALGFIVALILPLVMLALMDSGHLEQKQR